MAEQTPKTTPTTERRSRIGHFRAWLGRQARGHRTDTIAIFVLALVGIVMMLGIFTQQKASLPSWLPLVGEEFEHISAEFSTGAESVGWVFARDLLASGLYEPAGDGDVHVWPCLDVRGRAVVIFELCSPDGEALLQARADEVADFLQSTRDLVPQGSEGAHVDLDELVTRLLADPA